jgi:hypothetical protein
LERQLLVYAEDATQQYKYHKKKSKTLIDTSKEVGLEVNIEKTKYRLMYRQLNTRQKHSMETANNLLKMWQCPRIW